MPDDEVVRLADSRLGKVLRGKYRLDSVLGVGGMAAVYAATHRNKKRFAIKVLHPEYSLRENIRARFVREGYVANSVGHTGAVAVLDDDVAEDGSAFLVMELLEGKTVDELRTDAGSTLPLALALAIGDALLDVLAAAHAKGIVHRDIKPANLFVTNDGRLEVLDFGIARLHDETTAAAGNATQTGAMMGTPAFMAPEQALAEAGRIDAQTDLWAVGATLFTLLTGELVHEGANASQLLVNAATKRARSIASLATELPSPVAAVIDKALAFDKAERWPTAKDAREALRAACVEATGASIPRLPTREAAVTGMEETIAPTPETTSGAKSDDIGLESTIGAEVGLPAGGAGLAGASATTAAPVLRSEGEEPKPRRRRSVPMWAFALAGLVLTLGVGGAQSYRAAHASRTRMCADQADSMNGPRCVVEVSPDAAKKRFQSWYRFTEVDGRVTTVERVNFAGNIVHEDESWRAEVQRDAAGHVTDVVTRTPRGRGLEWRKWSPDARRVDLVQEDGATPRQRGRTQITTLRREFDALGRVSRETFFGVAGKPRPDATGAYGYAYEAGRLGRWTRRTVLAADGEPAAMASGVSACVRDDDDMPSGREERCFDVDGHPVAGPTGMVGMHREFDESYDEVGVTAFGLEHEPVAGSGRGWPHEAEGAHGVRRVWDSQKRTITQTGLDEHDRPHAALHGRLTSLRDTYDARGRRIEREVLDANGNCVQRGKEDEMGGTAGERTTWNERDEPIVREYFDERLRPFQSWEGIAKAEQDFDERGRLVETRFFDEKGRLAGWHAFPPVERLRYERDAWTSRSFFAADGKPASTFLGFASMSVGRDPVGRVVVVTLHGTDGRPVVVADNGGVDWEDYWGRVEISPGWATHRLTYDDAGDRVTSAFFDQDDAPIMVKGEYASEHDAYDDRGLRVEERFLDARGEPTLLAAHYSAVRYLRDRNGDVTEERYVGTHDEPILRDGGYARKTIAYDARRRRTESRLYGVSGAAVVGSEGWTTERVTYDPRGLVARLDYFDAGGNPVITKAGSASLTHAWDRQGNLLEQTTLGADGKPVRTDTGYATKRSAYDDHGDLVEESLLGADGAPSLGKEGWSIHKLRYDELGDIVEEDYLGADRGPVIPAGEEFSAKIVPYSSMRSRWERGERVEESYFDLAGAPTRTIRTTRDGYGRAVLVAFFDGANAPVASKEGTMVERKTYDDRGRLMEERFVDAAGSPRPANDGCAGHSYKYDVQGRVLEQSCLAVNDGFAMSSEGWGIRRTIRDGRGNPVDVSTYGPEGTLVADKDGVARRKNRFDERNHVLENTYFDALDKPIRDKNGVASVRFAYDASGKETEETPFDEKGRPVQRKVPTKR